MAQSGTPVERGSEPEGSPLPPGLAPEGERNGRVQGEFTPAFFTCLREGYSARTARGDLIAGLTVAVVALPLAMAIGIASGVTPSEGLITAIIAGFLISLLGGSRVQIGGPTGAFIVVVAGIVAEFGVHGLAIATLLAGVMLIAMGVMRFGQVIAFIPYPVTTGFTTGIGVIIFTSQVVDFLGVDIESRGGEFHERWLAIAKAIGTVDPSTVAVGLGSLALLLIGRRHFSRFPAPLGVVILASVVVALFGLPVETIGSRFGEIPGSIPSPKLPSFTLEEVRDLLPAAFTIALLAGIESLLSAVVADGMTGGRHKPNQQLIAQGIANLGSVLFGGSPATGAIARTATNVKSGGKTPFAGIIHAGALLGFVLALAPLAKHVPLPALSAILFLVAWNMSEVHRFLHLMRAPRSDVGVMLTTFLLTVLVDLTLAVEVGVVLAALLFVKRMRDFGGSVESVRSLKGDGDGFHGPQVGPHGESIPEGIQVFELAGPFFFGVADRWRGALSAIERPPRAVILRMRQVPVIDATGMSALGEFIDKCRRDHTKLYVTGMRPAVHETLRRSKLLERIGEENLAPNLATALEWAKSR